MGDIVIRFVVGGVFVSAFALIGSVLKPKSFAGLFGAAPSVALGSLALTISKEGTTYAATETRSMIAGAVALLVYCASVILLRTVRPNIGADLNLPTRIVVPGNSLLRIATAEAEGLARRHEPDRKMDVICGGGPAPTIGVFPGIA